MRHKIKIYGVTYLRDFNGPNYEGPHSVWYVQCECDWAPDTLYQHTDGLSRYGRPSWDMAFALGVAHQKEAKEVCDCE